MSNITDIELIRALLEDRDVKCVEVRFGHKAEKDITQVFTDKCYMHLSVDRHKVNNYEIKSFTQSTTPSKR